MQEDDLVRDVSTEELLMLRKKAAKHANTMKSVKNAKDVLAVTGGKPKSRVSNKNSSAPEAAPKLKKNYSDDKWLDDFSEMEDANTDYHAGTGFNIVNTQEVEITVDDVSKSNHKDDEVISDDILEELGVAVPKFSQDDQPETKKSIMIPGVKVHKKPISQPIVESPPEKPLGPRDSLSNDAPIAPNLVLDSDRNDNSVNIKKSRFGFKLRRMKNARGVELNQASSASEVSHVLYQDPSKEAEQRAEVVDDLLTEEDQLYNNDLEAQNEFDDSISKTVIEREEFRDNLQQEIESQNTDMIFTPEIMIMRNASKKPSGYSMVATISEGGYAFSHRPDKQEDTHSGDSKFSEIEKANKNRDVASSKSHFGLLDVISIIIIAVVMICFFYLVLKG
jgi:hypothetical protein